MCSIKGDITTLKSLNRFRSAPALNLNEAQRLKNELLSHIDQADWFTVGIMAPSQTIAIKALRGIESNFDWPAMTIVQDTIGSGPVFLKANQMTGEIHLRIEYGLGIGILLSCQYNQADKGSETFGPFPLDFFISNK